MKNSKYTLVLDKDGVINEILIPSLYIYKKYFDSKSNLTRKNIVTYDMKQLKKIKNTRSDLFVPYGKEIFLDMAKPIDEFVVPVINDLYSELKIVISTHQYPENEKFVFPMLEEFGIKYDDVKFEKDKNKTPGDIIMEDSPFNLIAAKRPAICYDSPYNQMWNGHRIKSHKETIKKIEEILKELRN